jgi:hypothetical protein
MGRTHAAIGLGALAALAAAVWACAGLEGLTEYQACSDGCSDAAAVPPTDHDVVGRGDSSAPASDASETGQGVDAAEEASQDNEDATDEGDDAASEDGLAADAGVCSGLTVDDASGIFVTPLGADGSGCGTSRSSPCKTIAAGIASATLNSGRTTVYVAAGTYVEKLALASGLTVQGGWQVSGTTWTFDCGQGDVTVQAPSSSSTTVLADGIAGGATLSTITVLSMAASSVQPGQSLYGIFARGSNTQLTLNDVVVSVAKAGDGPTGAMGSVGSPPSSSCSSGTGQSNTAAGALGAGASAGTFASAGFTPSAGATGGAGSAGTNGTSAPAPTPVMYSTCQRQLLGCNTNSSSCTGSAGKSGCAGGGGGGGKGGGGGGSSVALFVDGAQVTVSGGSFAAGDGGNGGAGGAGGAGAAGGAGTTGSSAQCQPATCQGFNCNNQGSMVTGAGSTGGTGGAGSAGGQGGGGSGGDSYAVVLLGGGQVGVSGASLVAGQPGVSLGNGPSGVAAMQGTF